MNKPFGAYANGFSKISKEFLKDRPTVDALTARKDLGPESIVILLLIGSGMAPQSLVDAAKLAPLISRRSQKDP